MVSKIKKKFLLVIGKNQEKIPNGIGSNILVLTTLANSLNCVRKQSPPHLVSLERQISLVAARVRPEQVIDELEQRLDALVLALVLAALHQEPVLPLVVAPDGQALGPAQGTQNREPLVEAFDLDVVLGHGLRFACVQVEMMKTQMKEVKLLLQTWRLEVIWPHGYLFWYLIVSESLKSSF